MISVMPAYCLTIHARYQCRHAGACCRTWTVPAEAHVVQLVARRGLRRSGVNGPLFVASRNPDSGGAMEVARDNNGRCVFFEQYAAGSCVIHREAGLEALPSACRHFPRKFLRDRRGTFVSLSHFCPTAALLLLDTAPLGVAGAAPPLMLDEPIEGLDAREALPPLLRPGLLCDLDGYGAWERACLDVLARSELTWEEALDSIAAATECVRSWRPGGSPLTEHVEDAFAQDRGHDAAPSLSPDRLIELMSQLARGRAGDLHPIDDFERRWSEHVGGTFAAHGAGMKNFIAARLFANWIAYQGRGLRSIVQWARAAAAAVRHYALIGTIESGKTDFLEAVRMTDLLMLHVLDTQQFADAVAPIENL